MNLTAAEKCELMTRQLASKAEQYGRETDARLIVIKQLRAENERLQCELKEVLYLLRTGATNEQLDLRVCRILEGNK